MTILNNMNKLIFFAGIIPLLLASCTQNKIEVTYLKDSQKCKETVHLDFISDSGTIVSPYIASVKFGYLDSISFPDRHPDNMKVQISYQPLNFKKRIKPYSPEYYAIYTIHNIHKAIKYYNSLFGNKIDFNSQTYHRDIEIVFGNTDIFSSPKTYCFEENSIMFPSLFFHEIGHRAFWYLEGELGINFNGLSIVHMGLLQYFTMSLNNSPVEMEEKPNKPNLFNRDARNIYNYPLDSTYTLRYTLTRLENASKNEITNPKSNISKYLSVFYSAYNDYLDVIYDNHLGGMVLASTLWHIREKIGQENTDKLVAQTILNLNEYLNLREDYYIGDKSKLYKGIDWSDVLFGMLEIDKKYFSGKNAPIIVDEFSKTGYPIQNVIYKKRQPTDKFSLRA